jgi:hypothetical protein
MGTQARTLWALAMVGLAACGTSTLFDGDGGADAAVTDAGPGDDGPTDGTVTFGDGASDAGGDVSCGFGSAGSFATQSSLDLFGQTVFFADGGTLPAGHYQIAYVDGCMKYNANQDWTVNAYAEDSGVADHWFLVTGPGGEAGTVELLMPPGTVGYLVQNGGYSTFTDCVDANVQLDQPREFDFDGGELGLWLSDSPYTDNVAGDNGRNPKWSLTLIGQPCPN